MPLFRVPSPRPPASSLRPALSPSLPASLQRRDLVAALAATVAAPSVALAQSAGGTPLRIGLTLPLSGMPQNIANRSATPDQAVDFLAGFQVATALERRGTPVEVIELDDGHDPARAAANIEALARRDVVAVSGLWTTAHAAAALPVAERLRLPVVGIRSAAMEFRGADRPWAFHLRPSVNDEMAALLRTLGGMNLNQLGVLHDADPRNAALLAHIRASGMKVAVAQPVSLTDKPGLSAAVRKVAGDPATKAIVLLMSAEGVVETMMELRGGGPVFVAPVCTLSNVISRSFAESRERSLNGLGVTSPFSNPAFSRTDLATRFRDAMNDRDLEPLTRSFTAFEGFLYGSVLVRTLVGMRGAPTTRETLAAQLRGRAMDLGGFPVRFDERQVGHQTVQLLYKFSAEGALKA